MHKACTCLFDNRRERGIIMLTIDNQIQVIDNAICRHIDSINGSTRGAISQDILTKLISFVEHIMLKFYANGTDIDDSEENINKAVEFTQVNGELKTLFKFRNYLKIVSIHYTLDENASERLMLKYYQYLMRIRNLMYKYFAFPILHNLNKFPLNLDTALQEYYAKIAEKVDQHPAYLGGDSERYYIQKVKPFFVNGKEYHEVTFTPATDKISKSNRVIAFTQLPITSFYASRFHLKEDSIQILGKTMPIIIIEGWEVSIRQCEFKNFASIITGKTKDIPYAEQKEICRSLTEGRFSLSEILDFSDAAYAQLTTGWRQKVKTDFFISVLDICRNAAKKELSGHNTLRYLLYGMNNTIIKAQRDSTPNYKLSNLYLRYGCLQFETAPFMRSTNEHNPQLGVLFECIPVNGRQHELLARQIRNNSEISGMIFTPLSALEHYGDVVSLAHQYNDTIYYKNYEKSRIIIKDGYVFINEYKEDTCKIIQLLQSLVGESDEEYSESINAWLSLEDSEVDCEEKRIILRKMFAQSKVAVIYGSAGVGKSTLIKHISRFYNDYTKLYLTQTNSANENLRRRVKADNTEFSTVASFIKYGSTQEYELLVIDECSTVSNKEMVDVLDKAKFKHILLVGDTFQISSIRFGNWFSALKCFMPTNSVFELTHPYRTTDPHLLEMWAKVRVMADNVQELIDKQSYSLRVDESLLSAVEEDEAVLCLNYDGLYGINNINRFLQESNPKPAYQWDVQQFKVNDPVLFLENNRFHPVVYNNMRGKIVGIEKLGAGTANERIQFDIELRGSIDSDAEMWYDFQYLRETDDGHSVIRFCVYKNKSTDDDDDGNTSRTIVPFQIAYAVSIHKAQGLEYRSVKIVVTDEIDELLTHNIFYTAITRAQEQLKIYWTPEVEHQVLDRIRPRDIENDVKILRGYLTTGHETEFPF
jgi:energy-coupling factor transporter ATP-binding protein EcfA2